MFFNNLELSSDSNFLKLEAGENKVRIVSAPIAQWTAFVDGKPKKFLTEEAANKHNKTADKEQKANKRYAMWVIDRKTNEILLAEFSKSIMKTIMAFANDSDIGFERLPPYDIKITKEGSGLETRYSVINLQPKELTDEEKQLVESQADLLGFLREDAEDKADVAPF